MHRRVQRKRRKEIHELPLNKNPIIKIDHWREEETVWEGYSSCNCFEKGKFRSIKLYLLKSHVIRFCFRCNIGMFENTVTGSKTKEYFNFHHLRWFKKVAVLWFDSSKIFGIEKRYLVGDVLRSVGLANIETGLAELVFFLQSMATSSLQMLCGHQL